MARSKIRVGIVGQRGLAFADGLQSLEQVELAALCDVNKATLDVQANTHGIEGRFTNYEAMLEQVDAVVVSTPVQWHAPQVIQALEAGKHVLSEVTAAVSLEECWRLVDAVKSSGKTYMFSENYCYMRDTVLIREMARKGLFGELYFGEGEYLHDIKFAHHTPEGNPTWRYYWQVGFNGSTYATHSLGPVMQWFTAVDPQERIESVVCIGTGRHTDPEHPQDDTSLLLCKLRSGKLVKVRVDMLSNRPHHMTYYTVQGTHGVFESTRNGQERGFVWLGDNPGAGYQTEQHRHWKPLDEFDEHLPEHWRNPPEAALKAGHGGGDYFVVSDWVQAIKTGEAPPIDVYTAAEWTAAGLCSQISIENGGASIKVPDFRNPAERPLILDAQPLRWPSF